MATIVQCLIFRSLQWCILWCLLLSIKRLHHSCPKKNAWTSKKAQIPTTPTASYVMHDITECLNLSSKTKILFFSPIYGIRSSWGKILSAMLGSTIYFIQPSRSSDNSKSKSWRRFSLAPACLMSSSTTALIIRISWLRYAEQRTNNHFAFTSADTWSRVPSEEYHHVMLM